MNPLAPHTHRGLPRSRHSRESGNPGKENGFRVKHGMTSNTSQFAAESFHFSETGIPEWGFRGPHFPKTYLPPLKRQRKLQVVFFKERLVRQDLR